MDPSVKAQRRAHVQQLRVVARECGCERVPDDAGRARVQACAAAIELSQARGKVCAREGCCEAVRLGLAQGLSGGAQEAGRGVSGLVCRGQ